MPRLMRWVSGLKRMTWTFTVWPIESASLGWLMRRHAISVTCSNPSTPPRSTKAPVIGDVLHHAGQNLAFLQIGDQFVAGLGAALLEHGAARNHDVAPRAIHLEDLERLRRAHQRADIAHRADVNLAAWQEGDGAG